MNLLTLLELLHLPTLLQVSQAKDLVRSPARNPEIGLIDELVSNSESPKDQKKMDEFHCRHGMIEFQAQTVVRMGPRSAIWRVSMRFMLVSLRDLK